MNFFPGEITGMLGEYEKDHHTGMFPQAVAEEICAYTSGYPVLVSGICKYIDEGISNPDCLGAVKRDREHGTARQVLFCP